MASISTRNPICVDPIQTIAQAYTAGKIGGLHSLSRHGKGVYDLLNFDSDVFNYLVTFGGHCDSLSAKILM